MVLILCFTRAIKEKNHEISGGFLIKMLKPIQDNRVDLPTVGLKYIKINK